MRKRPLSGANRQQYFTYFNNLPGELRVQIWESAHEELTVEAHGEIRHADVPDTLWQPEKWRINDQICGQVAYMSVFMYWPLLETCRSSRYACISFIERTVPFQKRMVQMFSQRLIYIDNFPNYVATYAWQTWIRQRGWSKPNYLKVRGLLPI